MSRSVVTIFGTARAKPGDAAYELAFETGGLLAGAGFVIANGGYGGTMEAAARGARQQDGKVIGVTCSAFARSSANPYVTRDITTDTLQQRLEKLVELGSAYIVLPGGTGTLLELAHVWELKNKGFLNRNKPIIIIGDFWKPLLELIATEDAAALKSVHRADDPHAAVQMLIRLIRAGQ